MVQVIRRSDLHNAFPDAEASYQFEGRTFGDVELSFFWTDAPSGCGPGLHQHVYAEIFVVLTGQVVFTVGSETITATSGQIVIAPAGQPHRFVNAGVRRSRHIDIHPTGRMNDPLTVRPERLTVPLVIRREDLRHSETSARFEGSEFGGVPVSFFWTDAPPGTGPSLHRHPYPEVFVVDQGRVVFTVGDETVDAAAGEIVVVPAGTAHRFVNLDPERSKHLDIHVSERMSTEWLES